MTVHYAHAAGTPVEQRDARGAHRIVIPAADKSEGLAKMAPQVFTLTIGGEATCDYGQFVSLLLLSVARLCLVGAPNKRFGEWRISIEAIARLWATCLEVISQRSDAELATLRLDRTATSSFGQRGEFILALRALRGFATQVQLSAFEITDSDFERIDAGSGHAPCPLTCAALTHEAGPPTLRDDPHWLRAHYPMGCCANPCPRIRLSVIHEYPRPLRLATHVQSRLPKALRGIRLPVIHARPRPLGVGRSCTVTATQDPPGHPAARDTRTPQTPRGGLCMYSHGHPRPSGVSGCP